VDRRDNVMSGTGLSLPPHPVNCAGQRARQRMTCQVRAASIHCPAVLFVRVKADMGGSYGLVVSASASGIDS
jgi:hypothetical protein